MYRNKTSRIFDFTLFRNGNVIFKIQFPQYITNNPTISITPELKLDFMYDSKTKQPFFQEPDFVGKPKPRNRELTEIELQVLLQLFLTVADNIRP